MYSIPLFTYITMISLFCSSLRPGKRSILVWFTGYLFNGMLVWKEVFVRLLYGTCTLLNVRDSDSQLRRWRKWRSDIPKSLLAGGLLISLRATCFLIGTNSCEQISRRTWKTNQWFIAHIVYFLFFTSGYCLIISTWGSD